MTYPILYLSIGTWKSLCINLLFHDDDDSDDDGEKYIYNFEQTYLAR